MDPRKFDYLESIREKIESGDFIELEEYLEDIRSIVKSDGEFNELFELMQSNNYQEALALIDEIIFEDMQSEFEEFYQEGEVKSVKGGLDVFDLEDDFDEEDEDRISFEPFDEELHFGVQEEDY